MRTSARQQFDSAWACSGELVALRAAHEVLETSEAPCEAVLVAPR